MASTLTKYIKGKGRHITGVKKQISLLKMALKKEKGSYLTSKTRQNGIIRSIDRGNSYPNEIRKENDKGRKKPV